MSTRCNIHFYGYGRVIANVYRHWDGYPSAVLQDLQQFFKDVESQTNDTRFTDASYLAAKFVVWQALQNAESNDSCNPLNFLGVGVTNEDAGDGEFVYKLNCEKMDANGRPTITHRPKLQRVDA